MNSENCVLHPTDFSEASEPAFDAALETARRHDADLLLLHVLEPRPPQCRDAAETAARTGFDRLLEIAKKAGVRASDVLLEGVPAAEIARFARERRVRLIVMGTHGHTRMPSVCRGTVAEEVIATAPCWVCMVRSSQVSGLRQAEQ